MLVSSERLTNRWGWVKHNKGLHDTETDGEDEDERS
jgi:hypothetical protein